MPPSLHLAYLRTIPRFRCLQSATPRFFTTSSPLSKDGPENPNYIEIPTTRQPQAFPKVDIKGTLPTPRKLFSKQAGDKLAPEYFKRTTPFRKTKTEPANDYEAWKRKIADNRQENLKRGLKSLHKRKQRADRRVALRSERKQAERNSLLNAPQREDERLTSPTVTEAVRTLQSELPDPNREARVAAKAERVRAKEAMRQEARKNALHTLYMHARSFITTEEQLNDEVERIFDSQTSVWAKEDGPPKTVREILASVNRTNRSVVEHYQGPQHITGQRMKKIGEELTGGKMD